VARINALLGQQLSVPGRNGHLRLSDGRRVLLVFREPQPIKSGATFTTGVPNRAAPDDFLVMLMGDDDLVVPVSVLTGGLDSGSRSGDGRPTPIVHRSIDGRFSIQFGQAGSTIDATKYVDAYSQLLPPADRGRLIDTFLLTWNPSRQESDATVNAIIASTKRGETSIQDWSVGLRRGGIKQGDRAFMVRQHEDRGVVAVGTFVSEAYKGTHWADANQDTTYALVEWSQWVEPADRLPVEELKTRIPGVIWDRLQGSGVKIHTSDAGKLADAWQNHLESVGLGSTVIADEVRPTETFVEGAVTRITVNRYERDPAARLACLAHWGFDCQVCGLNLKARFGLDAEFIHVHHVRDLATLGAGYEVDAVNDLRPVCPNCHAALHQTRPAMDLDTLRRRVSS
jgi:5-methylcytosine-specific restriction protein A